MLDLGLADHNGIGLLEMVVARSNQFTLAAAAQSELAAAGGQEWSAEQESR